MEKASIITRFRSDHFEAERRARRERDEITHIVVGYDTFYELMAHPDAYEIAGFTIPKDGELKLIGLPALRTPDLRGWLFVRGGHDDGRQSATRF